jgi:hypothetical protein
MALSSISLQLDDSDQESDQWRLDNMVEQYLPLHGQHVDSISLAGYPFFLSHLPASLTKLGSLVVNLLHMQLQPSDRYRGVLGAAEAPPLKQLRLHSCTLEGEEGLAAALVLLPGLEHLAITHCHEDGKEGNLHVPLGAVVPGLSKLTYLQLAPARASNAELQDLTALTRLVDLQLLVSGNCSITASMLSGAQHLTRLELAGKGDAEVSLEPAALAGRTVLQHLELCQPLGGAGGTAQLLCELQQLQQLTCLTLHSLQCAGGCPPAAAYSALTASSKLQCLDLSWCTLPAGVWQHVFPAGRQLPHLQYLMLDWVRHPLGPAAAPEGIRLVSCCPGLEILDLRGLQYSRGMLASLQGLSSLTVLRVKPADGSAEGLEGVCRLTGLQQLHVHEPPGAVEGLMLQLTQLRQLTHLRHSAWQAGAAWPRTHSFDQVSNSV